MIKSFLFIFTFILWAQGCGNKSKISGAIQARTFSETYGTGDGTVPFPLFLPLTEVPEVKSNVEGIGFLAGGIAKIIMDAGASIGMARFHTSLVQRVPVIPHEYMKDCRLKRVFFYLEPVAGYTDPNIFESFALGRRKMSFNFLDRIGIKVSSVHLSESDDWEPITGKLEPLTRELQNEFQRMFVNRNETYPTGVDVEHDSEIILLKYEQRDGREQNPYLKANENNTIYVASTTRTVETRRYLEKHKDLQGFFKRILILGNSVLLELHDNAIMKETFMRVINRDRDDALPASGITVIKPCSPDICMDLEVADLNLVPIIKRDNGIKLDAFIRAGKAPESFKLKGFLEFEFKLKAPKNV